MSATHILIIALVIALCVFQVYILAYHHGKYVARKEDDELRAMWRKLRWRIEEDDDE